MPLAKRRLHRLPERIETMSEETKIPVELTPDELRRAAGFAVQGWGAILADRLSVDDSWRLLLAGAVSVMQAEHTPDVIASLFRQMAEKIEAGHLDQPSNH
jgi:hypothetical protein